jgi:hypothetical protein
MPLGNDAYYRWISDFLDMPLELLTSGAPSANSSGNVSADTNELAPVSMHLPDESDRKAAKAKPAAPPAKTKTINFGPDEGEVMVAEFDPHLVLTTLPGIATRAEANASSVGIRILNACQKFSHYAEAKLDDVHDGASSLFKTILETSLDAVLGAKLIEKVAEKIGKEITNAVKKYVKDKIVDGATSGLKDDSSNKELKKALDNLTTAATDSGGAVADIVKKTLQPYLNTIEAAVKDHKELKPDQHSFLVKFMGSPSMWNAYLEELGIPDPANGKPIELEMYKKMVRGFELSVQKSELRNEMGKFEFADMAKMDPIGLKQKIRHRADERAETAMALRAEEMRRNGQ